MTISSSDAFVFFGATGDLAHKKIFPALQAMIRRGELDMPVIGMARAGWTLDKLRERARGSLEQNGGVDTDAFVKLSAQLNYVDGDYRDPATYESLKQALGGATRPLNYLAIPPSMFGTVVAGLANAGCADEAGVAVDSRVETFAALCLYIDTWRWAGVPFYIRAGKCLAVTATEVVVDLKCPPLAIFDEISPATSNYFRFRLSPEVVISAGARVKQPGEEMRGEPVELIARHQPRSEKLPYERLLRDALRGDPSLFTRDDSVEAAWRVTDPALDSGLGNAEPVSEYEPGTWGPAAAARIVSGDEGWHDPKPEETAPC